MFQNYTIDLDSDWRLETRQADKIETRISRILSGNEDLSSVLQAFSDDCCVETRGNVDGLDRSSVVGIRHGETYLTGEFKTQSAELPDEKLHHSLLEEVLNKKGIIVTPELIRLQQIESDSVPDFREYHIIGRAAEVMVSAFEGSSKSHPVFQQRYLIDANGQIVSSESSVPDGKRNDISFYADNKNYQFKLVIDYAPSHAPPQSAVAPAVALAAMQTVPD
jgi:hypothetical protein